LDYEVELVAVIGKPIADRKDVIPSVLGYTVGNDVSARDLQRSGIGFDLFSSKSLDHTTGLGPWIVTRDEFGHGTPDIGMSLKVNGETRQNARTGARGFTDRRRRLHRHARGRRLGQWALHPARRSGRGLARGYWHAQQPRDRQALIPTATNPQHNRHHFRQHLPVNHPSDAVRRSARK
jgi:hypothetical protein